MTVSCVNYQDEYEQFDAKHYFQSHLDFTGIYNTNFDKNNYRNTNHPIYLICQI